MGHSNHRLGLPEDLQPQYNDSVRRLRQSPSLLSFPQLFQMFDAPFHIPKYIQEALIREADLTMDQEWELFVYNITRQFAPDSHWLGRTTNGRRPGGG